MSIINQRINELAIKKFDDNNSKFAKFMGTSEANIRNYRKNTEPKSEFIVKLVQKLEINYEYLFEGKELKKSDAGISRLVIGDNNSNNNNVNSELSQQLSEKDRVIINLLKQQEVLITQMDRLTKKL
ncbi:MAG: hypothetical protein LBS50_05250 [Prevotellaceae bacterium]|jgi:hypothetical protein|nr:hypothetical protein [Prevotellaceae bacterium]